MGSNKKGNNEAKIARQDEQARQQKIRAGTANVDSIFNTQFTPEFFDARKQGYLDYATPQLEDQFSKAKEQLTFALARSGTNDSSIRAGKEAELKQKYDLNRQQIADSALSYSGQARNSVEDARNNLISTLNASGDAEGAANGALSRASALSTPPSYSALGDLFAGFTSALGTQAAAERATAQSIQARGSYRSPYNLGLFRTDDSVQTRG